MKGTALVDIYQHLQRRGATSRHNSCKYATVVNRGVRSDVKSRLVTILCVLQEWPGLRTNVIGEKTKIPVKSIERYFDILKKAGVIYYSGGKNIGGYYLSDHILRE